MYKIITVDLELPSSNEFLKKTIVNNPAQLEFIKIQDDKEGGITALFFEDSERQDNTQYVFTCYNEFPTYKKEEIEQSRSEYIDSIRLPNFEDYHYWHHVYMCKAMCACKVGEDE
jgi:hypothetical protein